MCSMYPDEPRPTGLVEYPRHKERQAAKQRFVKTSGERGGTVDLWYGTLGCWAGPRRLEAGRGILV